MPRPRTYDEPRVATAVRLPASVHQRLHEVASEREVSANLLITRAVSELLERLPSAEDALRSRTNGSRGARGSAS